MGNVVGRESELSQNLDLSIFEGSSSAVKNNGWWWFDVKLGHWNFDLQQFTAN